VVLRIRVIQFFQCSQLHLRKYIIIWELFPQLSIPIAMEEKPVAESTCYDSDIAIVAVLRGPLDSEPSVAIVDIVPAGAAHTDMAARCLDYVTSVVVDSVGKRNFQPTIDSTQDLDKYPAGAYVMRRQGMRRINLYFTHACPGFFTTSVRVDHLGWVEVCTAGKTTLGRELQRALWGDLCTAPHGMTPYNTPFDSPNRQSPSDSPADSPVGSPAVITKRLITKRLIAGRLDPVVATAWSAVVAELKLKKIE
jgi:hypothetical protein